MGNCCTSEDSQYQHQSQYQNFQQMPQRETQFQLQGANFGQLARDEDFPQQNVPNLNTFGQPVELIDNPYDQQQEIIHDGSQFLMQSRIQEKDREPLEKSFRAVIASPERTNRVRVVHQVPNGNFLNEPLADTQRDSRSMEPNRNIKTPSISNAIFNGAYVNDSQEKSFFNAATNSNINASQVISQQQLAPFQNNIQAVPQQQLEKSNIEPTINTSRVINQSASPLNQNPQQIHQNAQQAFQNAKLAYQNAPQISQRGVQAYQDIQAPTLNSQITPQNSQRISQSQIQQNIQYVSPYPQQMYSNIQQIQQDHQANFRNQDGSIQNIDGQEQREFQNVQLSSQITNVLKYSQAAPLN